MFKRLLLILLLFTIFSPAQSPTSWNISITDPTTTPTPFPLHNRPCCSETWNKLETASGVFNWAPLDSWIKQSQAHGSYMWYTLNHVPPWSNGSITATDTNGNTYDPPLDIQSTVCPDCTVKGFANALMQHVCNVKNAPTAPLVGVCSIRYFEAWNEFNGDGYWAGNYTQLAILVNDYFTIIRQYCGDCVLVAGSVSTSTGSHTNGETGYYDKAELEFLTDLAAIPNATLPTMISFHAYASRQDVFPVPFPTSVKSESSTLCPTNTSTPSCYVSIANSVTQFRKTLSALTWTVNLPVAITEGGWGLDAEVCDGANCNVSDSNVVTLRAAYASEWIITLAAQKPAIVMWYAYFNQCWGTLYGSGATQNDCVNAVTYPIQPLGPTGTLTAWNQTVQWVSGTMVGTLNSTSVPGGTVYTLNFVGYQLAFFDGWLGSYTMPTGYTQVQALDGVVESTRGSVTLSQSPVKLYGVLALNSPTSVTLSIK